MKKIYVVASWARKTCSYGYQERVKWFMAIAGKDPA